jgi:RND superfamily putative drug exporter
MSIDKTKATLGGAWLIALGAIALSETVFTADSSRALLLGFGVVPLAIVWMFWTPPERRLSESLAKAFPKYLLVVVGLAFILLTVVFRSVLVPLKAVLGFLLSVGVALGATVAVFQWGWLASLIGVDTSGPVLFMLPLLLTGILFGLAMDYEVFLVSRMREEYTHGRPAKESVVIGFQYGARVVTAAAAIMIGVFGGFALGDDIIIKSIGFGLAVGVLADAFLVRMTIVPAFMALMGDRMWWMPKWLDTSLPNLDIEGESLERHLGPDADGGKHAATPHAHAG